MSKQYKVLAIDDEEDNRMLVRAALESDDYLVEIGINGEDGLKKAETFMPDLIICDMMMPDIDGFEVLKRLRAKDSTFAIAVIMLTGIDSRDKVRQALDSGIDYYVTKPFEIGDLLAKVETILKNSPSPTDDNGIPGLF